MSKRNPPVPLGETNMAVSKRKKMIREAAKAAGLDPANVEWRVDGDTGQTVAYGADAVAETVKKDVTPELHRAGFSDTEIEQLFRPDRPTH